MVISAPTFVLYIGDCMNPYLTNSLTLFYRLLLNVYPPAYRAEFEDEMYDTFIEGIKEADSQGRLGRFIFRELCDTPKVLVHAYWEGWKRKLQTGIQILQEAASPSDLPPAPPDGRDSWRQVLFECSSFIIAGLLLILATYHPLPGFSANWQRNPEFLGKIIVPLTLPLFLFGLARGLPRWAYPFGGLLLGYYALVSNQTGLWPLLVILLLASSVLAFITIIIDSQPFVLPHAIRRISQSLSVDWTRLSFALYGAMPLVILMAFDDSHYNNRTPYFAFSILIMMISALIYCRHRVRSMQIAALVTGVTLSIGCAWLDGITYSNGLMNWTIVSSRGDTGYLWIFTLWIQWILLMLSPAFLTTLGRRITPTRAT